MGKGHGVIIVAELSCNHAGDFARAQALIRAAKWAGADWVKAQHYIPADLTLKKSTPEFTIQSGPWRGYTLWELYEQAQTPEAWIDPMMALAGELGMGFALSVYSPRGVEVAVKHKVPVLKVASFELGWPDFLKSVRDTGLPVVLSTGTSDLPEIERAMDIFAGREVVLLKCTSAYPAPLATMNLRTILDMKDRFKVPVGLSDHSEGIVASVAATALGVNMIEKHLKLDEAGLDSFFSLDPAQFKAMVTTVRATEDALGEVSYIPASTRYKRKEVDGVWLRTAQ